MAGTSPNFRVPLRGELLVKLVERYPSLDYSVIGILNTLKSVSQEFTDRFATRLADHNLTEGKFYVLAYLFVEELVGHEPPNPSDIALNLGVTRATITGLVDGLERAGLVERHTVAGDRRMVTIAITAAARQVLDDIAPSIAVLLQPVVTDVLTTEERDTLFAILSKLDTRLRQSAE